MTLNGIDFLYKHLGYKLSEEYEVVDVPLGAICACCKRPSLDWLEADRCIVGNYSGRKEVHCLSCQTLYHGSFDLIGHEGFRKGGAPTALKIGMLKGCGLLLSEHMSLLYAPGKYYSKVLNAPKSIFDEVLDIGGRAIILDALKRKIKTPYLIIDNFGVKKVDLVKNLRVTTNESIIYVCSQDTVYDLPVSYLSFSSAVDSLSKNEKTEFLSLMKYQTSRYLSVKEHKQFAGYIMANTQLAAAMREAPSDPHLRFKYARLSEAS